MSVKITNTDLYPTFMRSASVGLNLKLENSMVTGLGADVMKIALSEGEYEAIVASIDASITSFLPADILTPFGTISLSIQCWFFFFLAL
jgi:hypothetical protein